MDENDHQGIFHQATWQAIFWDWCAHRGRDRASLIRCRFGGFLADEKALKEIFGIKGAGGSKPCIACSNLVQFIDADVVDGSRFVGPDVVDHRLLQYHDSDSIYAIVDKLRSAHGAAKKGTLERLEQAYGVNYVPQGLLFDDELRSIIRPVDHYIRDPMHMLLSTGVAGTETARLVAAIVEEGIGYQHLQSYISVFTLPHTHGKAPVELLCAHRVSTDHMRCFASELLTLVPLLLAFMEDVMVPLGLLMDQYRCYLSLVRILQICSFAPRKAAQVSAELKASIVDHHTRYRVLYPEYIKPKFHMLLHCHENVDYLGMLLSCFVTERKHRSVKRAAVWTFANFETTLVVDVLQRDIEYLRGGNAFARESLINPVDCHGLTTATEAQLPGGAVHRGDLVACRGHRVIELDRFWQGKEGIVAQGRSLLVVNPACPTVWRRSEDIVFVPSEEVIMPLSSAPRKHDLRLILPPAGLGFDGVAL